MAKPVRTVLDFNWNWKFVWDDVPGAHAAGYDDREWREVRLPHDWSIERSFTQEDTIGITAWLPAGVGWYRKTFAMPEQARGRVTWIEFDGVYRNSEVWLNGQRLGERPYGYSPFAYDLTPYLRYGDRPNVLAVRVNRSSPIDSRWYPGSGIYRNVKLVTAAPAHIPQYGVFVNTPEVTSERAEVSVQAEVVNRASSAQTVRLMIELYDPNGVVVGQQEAALSIEAGERCAVEQVFSIARPRLWSTDDPNLYSAWCRVVGESGLLDEVETPFGIREIRFDPETGFYLNGENTLFKGVCLHHDGGCVGAAVPIGVWERRLKALKEAGCNAIRTSHNPPAAEFLDLCDRMGFLVQDEAFDAWTHPKTEAGYGNDFPEWGEADVKAMVLRDRNHPSVVMWSVGNEIEWTYPRYLTASGYWDDEGGPGAEADYRLDPPPLDVPAMQSRFEAVDPGEYPLAPVAQQLSGWIKELDTTRPVTANLVLPCVGHWSGFTDALDIVGYSYRQPVYDYGHRMYPDKMIFGSENFGQWHEWKAVLDRPFVPGIFLWTGIDYLGEAREWPAKASPAGVFDLACFKKPRFHMFKSLWRDEPHVYMATSRLDGSDYEVVDGQVLHKRRNERWQPTWHWHEVNEHWNYALGDAVVVEAYTNCPEVELFSNGASAGVRRLADCEDQILKWSVTYEPGALVAVGRAEGGPVQYTLATAGEPAAVRLAADKTALRADGYDVAHLTAQVCDAEGHPIRAEEHEVTFEIEGACRLLGVDNGSNTSVQDYQGGLATAACGLTARCTTAQGRCLSIVQSTAEAGTVRITASAEGLEGQSVELQIC